MRNLGYWIPASLRLRTSTGSVAAQGGKQEWQFTYFILFFLAFILYKLIKPVFFNIIFGEQSKMKKTQDAQKEDFQKKHRDKIEDAD